MSPCKQIMIQKCNCQQYFGTKGIFWSTPKKICLLVKNNSLTEQNINNKGIDSKRRRGHRKMVRHRFSSSIATVNDENIYTLPPSIWSIHKSIRARSTDLTDDRCEGTHPHHPCLIDSVPYFPYFTYAFLVSYYKYGNFCGTYTPGNYFVNSSYLSQQLYNDLLICNLWQ